MKYLLNYLESIPDAPSLSDPDFQKLLTDVQQSKSQSKSNDAFYEAMEKIVAELKSAPESVAFQKPVSKRDAPDYYEIIKHPMDLASVLKNVKSHRYRSKADFVRDLDLIWDNCVRYNFEKHPLRAAARVMKQKADHHLNFLVDKADRDKDSISALLPTPSGASPAPSQLLRASASGVHTPSHPSSLRAVSNAPGDDEDAAGESDDGYGLGDESFQSDGQSFLRAPDDGAGAKYGRSKSRDRRGTSVVSGAGDGRAGSSRAGSTFRTTQSFRPKLETSLDVAPALVRTPHTMTQYLPISLNLPGPSFSDKGKAKEVLYTTPPPAWFPAMADNEDNRLEGSWWTVLGKDDAYVGGLPSAPGMVQATPPKCKRIPSRRRRTSIPNGSGPARPAGQPGLAGSAGSPTGDSSTVPDLVPPRPKSLGNVIQRSVDKLSDARKMINQTQEFQRIEAEGGVLPPIDFGEADREREKEEAKERKRKNQVERGESNKRRKLGGEVGEKEAALTMKRATASLLAHSGFEGANEAALDMFTRVAIDHVRNMGRTLRLLVDGFSQKMTSEEIVLHALHENGQMQPQDLETHIKDEIEREGVKIAELSRKVRQAYKETTTAPVIEDDMMFAEDGEMLMDGNFADELGEDFLGLRDLGVAQEHGMSSLTVPSSLFYGRKKRAVDAGHLGGKANQPDYPPPPPFIPLNQNTLHTHLPALLHSFFAQRLESGLGLADDPAFDAAHTQIGSLGQIVSKTGPSVAKKKKEVEEKKVVKEKKPAKKGPSTGVGKGNWIRPSKEERAKKAAEKAARANGGDGLAGGSPPASDDAMGEEEDAEGEEE